MHYLELLSFYTPSTTNLHLFSDLEIFQNSRFFRPKKLYLVETAFSRNITILDGYVMEFDAKKNRS